MCSIFIGKAHRRKFFNDKNFPNRLPYCGKFSWGEIFIDFVKIDFRVGKIFASVHIK